MQHATLCTAFSFSALPLVKVVKISIVGLIYSTLVFFLINVLEITKAICPIEKNWKIELTRKRKKKNHFQTHQSLRPNEHVG
jgi:hypothetical protein